MLAIAAGETDVDGRMLIVAALLLCQACANTPSRHAAAVREADARQVTNCTLLSSITGRSLFGGVGTTGSANAIVDAKEQASGLGGNVIVLQGVDDGSMTVPATAAARAYRCN
jgi:phosphoheptose isomerase